MRQLAALRSFARHLDAQGHGTASALAAMRSPKVDRRLPRPLSAASALAVADADSRAGDARAPWILARDAAVLALLYGAGLRISEALGLTAPGRADRPGGCPSPSPARATRRAWSRCCRRCGAQSTTT